MDEWNTVMDGDGICDVLGRGCCFKGNVSDKSADARQAKLEEM